MQQAYCVCLTGALNINFQRPQDATWKQALAPAFDDSFPVEDDGGAWPRRRLVFEPLPASPAEVPKLAAQPSDVDSSADALLHKGCAEPPLAARRAGNGSAGNDSTSSGSAFDAVASSCEEGSCTPLASDRAGTTGSGSVEMDSASINSDFGGLSSLEGHAPFSPARTGAGTGNCSEDDRTSQGCDVGSDVSSIVGSAFSPIAMAGADAAGSCSVQADLTSDASDFEAGSSAFSPLAMTLASVAGSVSAGAAVFWFARLSASSSSSRSKKHMLGGERSVSYHPEYLGFCSEAQMP